MSNKIIHENPFENLLYFIRGTISEEVNCQLVGQVLTIIDSSIVNERQNKAVKDLIRIRFCKASHGIKKVLEESLRKLAATQSQEITTGQTDPKSK
ncbi:hypothetical protein KAW50_03530 [candidate division WOR-3 bacterium]|nr:hypothetical protein [candidate division WOR-3 bacterium]